MSRLFCVALSLLAPACATVGPHADRRTPVAASRAPTFERVAEAATTPGCDGVELELLVREDTPLPHGGWSRRIGLRCHARGATLTYETDAGLESEGGSETIELTPADAAALWAELRGLSLASLECGSSSTGVRSHRVEIVAARGARIIECDAAETPQAWSALEAILRSSRASDETVLWPYDADYWRDEIRYAGSAR